MRNKNTARQVIVNFDEEINAKLEALKDHYGFNSLAETLRFITAGAYNQLPK